MLKKKYLVIMVVLFFGLVVSGCTDNTPIADEQTSGDVEDTDTSIAEEALNEEMVGVTDTEVSDIEEEIAEIDALINETNGTEEEIIVQEI
ncbi:hypothetical protein [Methanolobus profundi]|uniref:Uncharacterized protein n=1 Tax=Methanolobus profundi TaxID=487685 RepID=A0A1I4S1I5_9EURY|nr:hypothetical protein [Methanolobus profundi]SFM58140.1 hypothetical protein SAMN04488696_1704 [Methanolobus profundi]